MRYSDPVVAEVFGVAVAGDHLAAVGEHLVHLGNVVGVQEVVGVEDKEAVVFFVGVVLGDFTQEEFKGVALAHLGLVAAGPDHGPPGCGHGGGIVGTVIGHHKDIDQLGGVILGFDAVDELADDSGLISRGDEHSEAAQAFGLKAAAGPPQAEQQVEDLVAAAGGDHRRDDEVDI